MAKYIFDKLKWLCAFIAVSACVERIYFDVPGAQLQLIVEGMISDGPPPYSVKVSGGLNIDSDTSAIQPIEKLKITLFDDLGTSESLIEKSNGEYLSSGKIQGQVGRSYSIRIETPDGKIFESSPDKLFAVGEIDSIRYVFEEKTVVKSFGVVKADVFNIFVDSQVNPPSEEESFTRWKFTGTYRVITRPELNLTFIPGYAPFADPYPCSGYVITLGPEGSGGILEKRGECECCICWPNQFETAPQLSDAQLTTNGQFKNVRVAEVPINSSTFFEKYLVEIEQMSLSRQAYVFFKLVRDQKLGASSLFQPPSGEIRGNIRAINNSSTVVGIFWATSIKKKSKFIFPSDVPYRLTNIEFNTKPCYVTYKNAKTTKPVNW